MRKWIISVVVVGACAGRLHAESTPPVGAAPVGDPKVVATVAIAYAEHPCPKVTKAARLKDGSIKAYCSNAEDYRVMTLQSQTVVLRCSEARKMGIAGC